METQKFTRQPFSLDAVQVTPANIEEVAKWCGGTVTSASYTMMGGVHTLPKSCIMLSKQGPKNNKTRQVLIGHWITKHRGQFRNWTNEAFTASFTKTAGFKVGELVRANNEIWAGWEGKVIDPHLVGVDFGARGKFVFEPAWIEKISEMSEEQLLLNAGAQREGQQGDLVDQVLNDMRQESKDRIAALEAENLSYDPNEIRVGNFVKVLPHQSNNEHSKTFVGQHGDVVKSDTVFRTVEFATADPDAPEFVTFLVDALEKVRQDGEPLNLEEPWDSAIPPAGAEERAVEISKKEDVSYAEAIKLVHEQDKVTINQFREQLGMRPLGANGEELLSKSSIEHLRTLTPELFARFVEVQKDGEELLDGAIKKAPWEGVEGAKPHEYNDLVKIVAERSPYVGEQGVVKLIENPNEYVVDIQGFDGLHRFAWDELEVLPKEAPETNPTFEVGDMIETLIEHEFDGVTIPVGTNGRITVLGTEVPDRGIFGHEVMFADGHYHTFAHSELKKV